MKKKVRRVVVSSVRPEKPERYRGWIAAWLIVAVLVLVVGLWGWYAFGNKKPDKQKFVPQYSLSEMQYAWSNNFQQVFDQGLLLNKYPIPEIQSRYNSALQLASQRYGSTVAISLVATYCTASKDVVCGYSFTNGHPTVEIIVPTLLDICKIEQQKNPAGWQDRMRLMFVTSFMHELDHLAFGVILKEDDKPASLDQLANEEANIWALTCENTLKPLIEKHKVQLTGYDYIYYNAWLKAGRDKNSQSWRNFIHWAYSRTR